MNVDTPPEAPKPTVRMEFLCDSPEQPTHRAWRPDARHRVFKKNDQEYIIIYSDDCKGA